MTDRDRLIQCARGYLAYARESRLRGHKAMAVNLLNWTAFARRLAQERDVRWVDAKFAHWRN